MIDKSMILKTVGWTTIGIGLCMVGLASTYSDEPVRFKSDDDVIDVEYTIIEE